MATPKKLPSGNWRVRVYDYTDESNVRHYRSFTAATKKECSYMAAEFSQKFYLTVRSGVIRHSAKTTIKVLKPYGFGH